MVDDIELKELQGVYEKMDAKGKHTMLSMAENLLKAQKLTIPEESLPEDKEEARKEEG